MPLLSTPVTVDKRAYYDGGPSMPVAYQKALDEGYEKIVLILTRHKGYRKSAFPRLHRAALKGKFRRHPDFYQMMKASPSWYNQMMDDIDRLEEKVGIFVILPSTLGLVSRTEKDME